MSHQHQERGGRGSCRGSGGGKNDRGAADGEVADVAAGGAAAGTTCGGRNRSDSSLTSSDLGRGSSGG
jgi:hypothetical protein